MTAIAREISTDMRRANYPLARWYLWPLAGRFADALVSTSVRPWHLTCCGLGFGLAGAAVIAQDAYPSAWAALLVLLAWFCDRADGQLARRQRTVSLWGAWLDANVDELLDVLWHVAIAMVVSERLGHALGFLLLAAFLGGKYLFMYGLSVEPRAASEAAVVVDSPSVPKLHRLARSLYHAPANADIRVHFLVVALATGWLAAELVAVASYYNLRWIARYALVARRLGRVPGGST